MRVHDFLDKKLGKAIPYGVYDLTPQPGLGERRASTTTRPAFAAASIRRWWQEMGAARFPRAGRLLITADGGGSNGYRGRGCGRWPCRDWPTRSGLALTVCHFPPGTSKWNKIEHRLFCHITQNWRGRPLVSHEVIVNLIAATTTAKGLTVRAALDTNPYPTGIKVTDEQMAALRIVPAEFHGEWNYTVKPRRRS